MTALPFVDLFAGIGGFHQALSVDDLGGVCVFASDIDPACQAVYADNYGVPIEGDIRPIVETGAMQLPPHDLLCAGFPCQPFSKSGHQRGIAETRGTLFYDICVILKAHRPMFVLLENVRNLVGPRHRHTWSTIIRILREIGYAVSDEPTLLSPHNLPPNLDGRPQARDRVFIPGVFVGPSAASRLSLPALVDRHPTPGWSASQWRIEELLEDETSIQAGRFSLTHEKTVAVDRWNDLIVRVRAELPRFPIWTDVFLGRLAPSEQHPAWKNGLIAKNQAFFDANRSTISSWLERYDGLGGVFPSYRKLEWQARDSKRDLWALALQFRPSGIRAKPPTYLPALVAINQTPIIGSRRRRITPREAARLQGFPDEFRLHPDDAVAYRQLGNAVSVGVTRYLARALVLGSAGRGDVAPRWEWLKARELAEAAAAMLDRGSELAAVE